MRMILKWNVYNTTSLPVCTIPLTPCTKVELAAASPHNKTRKEMGNADQFSPETPPANIVNLTQVQVSLLHQLMGWGIGR